MQQVGGISMEKLGSIYNRFGTIIVLLALMLIVTIINPQFLTMYNILNIFKQVSINGLIALGMTFVILTGGIDLSVGAILGFSGMILGLMITGEHQIY